jgi:hypothetical protein
MTYELIIETPVQDYMSLYSHNRDGLMEALDRIETFQLSGNFVQAQITSEKDGLVFRSSKKNESTYRMRI